MPVDSIAQLVELSRYPKCEFKYRARDNEFFKNSEYQFATAKIILPQKFT